MKGVTIFTEMSALAQQHNAINLSQGFPDFDLSPKLGEFLQEAFQYGYNQYAPMAGLPMLQYSIVHRIKEKYNTTRSANENITVTPGATYGIYCALAACIEPKDEVIILEPAYDSYAQNIIALGGKVIRVNLRSKTFDVDWQKVKEAITDKTKAIIINTPHNPSGAMWAASDYSELKSIVRSTNIKIISDEVYDHLTFEGNQHYSLMQDEELFQRTFAIFSFGKVLQATGWKIGYVVAPSNLTNDFRKAHQYIGFSVNSVSQYAIANYLLADHQLDKLSAIFEAKRDLMLDNFSQLPLSVPFKSMGSYFQIFSFENLSSLSDRAYAKQLVKEAKVASIPLSPFFYEESDTQLLRFCFAKDDNTIKEAATKLKSYFST